MKRIALCLLSVAVLFALPAFAAAPTCAVGAKGAAPTANITFAAPTLYADGTTIPSGTALTYNLYQGTASGAETKVATLLSGSPISVSTGLSNATTYYWYVTVVDAAGESAPGSEGCKIFPGSVTGAVTITVN